MDAFLNLFKDRFVGYAVLAFVVLTGVVDIKMAGDPNARPDANTGEQGRARDKLISELQEDVIQLTAEIMEWETMRELRYDNINERLGRHDERLKNNKTMIADCLRRTNYDRSQ